MKGMLLIAVAAIACYLCIAEAANDVNILVVGNAGVGKSTLINLLMDEDLAPIGVDTTGTTDVNVYKITKYGNRFHFYDTPGLNDLENAADIPHLVAKKVKSMNLIVFCLDLSAPRLYATDMSMITEYRDRFGCGIMDNAMVVFTKANLAKRPHAVGENRKAALIKHTGSIPYLYAADKITGADWVPKLWVAMSERSVNKAYMMQSSYYKINLCDPMAQIMTYSSKNLYPSFTNEAVTNSYNECVTRRHHEHRMRSERNAATMGLGALLAFGLLTIATGGGAALMGGLAAAGGGSLAAGGLGVVGGSMLIATMGATSGIMMTEYRDSDCLAYATQQMQHVINHSHEDMYLYANDMVAFAGVFVNNKPNGLGVAYDKSGSIIWEGLFHNGVSEVCKGIV